MKSFLALALGFILKLFLEGFSRIIIAFFNAIEYSFFGIGSLPSPFWIFIIYVISIVSTWFGCMMMLTISDKMPGKHLLYFILMVLIWHLFEVASSWYFVPKWYLFTFPLMSILGIILAKKTYELNKKAMLQ